MSPLLMSRERPLRWFARPVCDGMTLGIAKGRIVTSGRNDAFGRQTAFNMLKDTLTRPLAQPAKQVLC